MTAVSSFQLLAISRQLIKFLLFFTLATFYFLLSTNSAFAQTATPSAVTYQRLPQNLPSQSPHGMSIALYNFGHALSCILMGESAIAPCLEYKFMQDAQGAIKSYPVLASVNTTGGLLGMSGSALTLVYTEKPLDQASFFTYLGRNIGIVKDANAQVGGSGNQVLSPIFALWTVSRNFSYLLMILIFVGVGLMVMFRQKLNPQTVVSVQMALPGLVVGLVLITFSYFIASLITDTAYVGTDLVGYYFDEAIKTVDPAFAPLSLTERLATHSPLTVGSGSSKILNEETIGGFIQQVYSNLPESTSERLLEPKRVVQVFAGGLTYLLYNSLLSPIWDTFSTAVSTLASPFARFQRLNGAVRVGTSLAAGFGTADAASKGIAAFLDPVGWLSFWGTILAVIILIVTVIKLFVRLINCYLTIILLTITSPFVFLASSIPGRQNLTVSWLRNMLCNVLAFPAVIAVFYFAAFLVGQNQVPGFGVSAQLDITSVTGNFPFLGGVNLEFLRRILAFVAILATPSIPDIICRTVGKPGQGGAMLAGAVGGAIAGGQRYEGQISSQAQKAGSDVGSWKQALFGTTPYTGGRGGTIQLGLHQLRTGKMPEAKQELGRLSPVGAPPPTIFERIIEGVRRSGNAGPASAGEVIEIQRHRRWGN